MEVFNIDENGEYELVTQGNVLRDVLKNEENVYVILTHDWKICWIWIGKKCKNIRKKFAGARTSRSILSERRLAYSVKTVDAGEEPKIFKEILGNKISKVYKSEAASLEHIKIQKMVLKHEIPANYRREAILIGNKFYVAVEINVMGNITHKFETSEFLPEGMSELPENYIGRLFVKHGRVQALEFLVKNHADKKVEEKKRKDTIEKVKKEKEPKTKQDSEKKTEELAEKKGDKSTTTIKKTPTKTVKKHKRSKSKRKKRIKK
ncbi:MAG: hypothetical protein ACTSO9_01825 [Candidatus Helarchaeota archaeon]